MPLEKREKQDDAVVSWRESTGFFLALTKPEGGEIVLSVEEAPELLVGVKATAAEARQIAAALLDLADIVDKGE